MRLLNKLLCNDWPAIVYWSTGVFWPDSVYTYSTSSCVSFKSSNSACTCKWLAICQE